MADDGGGRGERLWRVVGAVVAAVVLTVAAPVVVLTMMVSAVIFRASPCFMQLRLGQHGRTISVPKVRSLPCSVPATVDKYALATFAPGRWSRVLRRSHIDELPQLALVIVGRMALVGPRPELPEIAVHQQPSFARARTSVPPGITGLWQISEAAGGLIHERPDFDLLYLEHRSVRFDCWIMWRTLIQTLHLAPPVTMSSIPPRFAVGHSSALLAGDDEPRLASARWLPAEGLPAAEAIARRFDDGLRVTRAPAEPVSVTRASSVE